MTAKTEKSYVVVEEAKQLNYLNNYVALPKEYGTPSYYGREDVKEIRRVVFSALATLDEKIDLRKQINGRHVIIKPNLVAVYHNMGYKNADMPQSTDPRVFEAVVDYISRYTNRITIAESSGGAMGTTSNFKTTGLDRIAKKYHTGLVAFENLPIDRYMLPKAEVMKEVCIPRLLSEIVRGEAYYISVPKMKTNLYTGVTLGFKNAMGTLPVNMRYRNHSYQIEKKLVDLLYLFKPDLTVIDGIVGAEGLTPGPVDPVDSKMIVVSNNSVEADRLTTEMMGFDSKENVLIKEAVSRGYGDPKTEIIGTPKYFKFRPADRSLLSERFQANFPNVKLLIGVTKNDTTHKITSVDEVTPELVSEMEGMCNGGCRPAIAQVFEMYLYSKKPIDKNFKLAIIYGSGIKIDGVTYYFDGNGKAYNKKDINELQMKKYAIGECAREMEPFADLFTGGCCDIGAATLGLPGVTGIPLPAMSMDNKGMPGMMKSMLETYLIRRKMLNKGEYYDVPYDQKDFDKVFPVPTLSEAEMKQDFIEWPLPRMTEHVKKEKLKNLKLM